MLSRNLHIPILWVFFLLCGCTSQIIFDETYPTPLQGRRAATVSLTPIKFTEGLSDFAAPPVGSGDAAGHYAALFILYGLEPGGRIDIGGQGVAELIRGAECARCSVGKKLAELRPSPDAAIPVVKVLASYANAAVLRSKKLAAEGLPDEAENVLRSVCNFGRHFARSEDDLAFAIAGVKALRAGATALLEFGRDRQDLAAACESFLERLRENEDALRKKYRAISDYTEFGSLEACIKVVTADPAPMWRKEACIGLALFRFGALRADGARTILIRNKEMEKRAGEVLEGVAKNDSDEAVRKLAAWCLENVTAEDLASARLGSPGAGGAGP